jgi:ParB-like chromosome segregation protein Spo0J
MPEDLTQGLPQEGQDQMEQLNLDNTDVKKLMEQYGLSEEDLNSFLQEELSTEAEDIVPETPQITEQKTEEKKYAGIFNTVEELEKSYKELQAEYTRQRQRIKKFESFIDLLEGNPEYADYIVEKTREFFFKDNNKSSKKEYETEEFENLFGEEETEGVKKFALNKEDILNLVRQEVNQALAAQRLIDDFRRKYPEVTDEELLKIINHARQFGGDLETSYMVLYKDRFKERLLRQALEEMKKGISPQRPGARVEATPTKRELTEDDYFQLAREIVAGKRRLDELDPNERAKLLNIIARQLIIM